MADEMTPREWAELARLSEKAAKHEKKAYSNLNGYNYLIGVARYAGRMAG